MNEVKPTLIYNSTGESGNIFWILAMVDKLLGRQKGKEVFNEVQTNATSYEQALKIIGKYVELVDSPNVK